jgi:hypothetical protein
VKLYEILEALTASPKQKRADQSWVFKQVKIDHPLHKDKVGKVLSVSKNGEWVFVKVPGAKDPKGRPLKEVPFKADQLSMV